MLEDVLAARDDDVFAAVAKVVLLDVHLRDGGSEAVIAGVAQDRPAVKFLALSVSDAAEDVIGVIRAGARGYVLKRSPVPS